MKWKLETMQTSRQMILRGRAIIEEKNTFGVTTIREMSTNGSLRQSDVRLTVIAV